MKFLVDNCAGGFLADWLSGQGHDVVYAPDLGDDPGDDALLALAVKDRRVVVTLDKGFARSVFVADAASTGMILLPDVPPLRRCELVAGILEFHDADLKQGAWVVLRRGKVRIRRFPG